MKSLSPAQRRELRARAHGLHPVAMISEAGLSAGVLAEIERGLKIHELIKIRVFASDREQRDALLLEICTQSGAQAVQHIGKILVIYREKPPEDTPRRAPARKAPAFRKGPARRRDKPIGSRSAGPGAKRPRTPESLPRRERPESPARSSAHPRRGTAVARPSQRRTSRAR